jgi:hypothetical protein
MEDIERLAVKPRSSTVPPDGAPNGDAAPEEQPRASQPPDAASMGNAMKALFDSRASAEEESGMDFEAVPAAEGRFPEAADSAAARPEPPPPPPDEAAEEKPVVGPAVTPAASEQTPVLPSTGSAKADVEPAAGRKALWIAALLAVCAAAVVWIVVGGLPSSAPPDREPIAPTGSVSPQPSLPETGAAPGDGTGSAEEETATEDEIGGKRKASRRHRRKRRARAARPASDKEVREPAREEPPETGESETAEEITGDSQTGTGEFAAAAETESAAAAEAAPAEETPVPAGEPEGARSASIGTAMAGEPLSQVPDRESVKAAMERIFPEVRACAGGKRGVVEVVLKVKNTGHVSHAVVGGDFAGTPEGSCIARAVRKTRLPPFLRPSFTLVYPFSL